jgi:hypothetical protein
VYEAARELLPALGTGTRPSTVPEILILLMLDRASPAPKGATAAAQAAEDAQSALLALPRALAAAAQDPRKDDAAVARDIQDELKAWKTAVTNARDWCHRQADELKTKEGLGVHAFQEALRQPNSAMPIWLVRRLQRSLELTQRLYPTLVRRHTENSLREMERRFDTSLARVAKVEAVLAKGEQLSDEDMPKRPMQENDKGEKTPPPPLPGHLGRNLVALKTLADELVPEPLAMFENVALAADNAAPNPRQVVAMFHDYAIERRKMDRRLGTDAVGLEASANYARLQALEAGLNLWLRRVSEAMSRSLEQQFYRRYVNELRLLANKQLGKLSARDILQEAHINEVPDVARDLLLADTGVNVFVSNSISLQFAPDTKNSVSAQVQAELPSKQGLLERVQQASQAATAMNTLTKQYGIDGAAIVKALLAGGQAVPVQSGIDLAATPSIGFDAGTVTLTLTANETLQPGSDKVTDRVTNHAINNATVTAISYEPMVLSTLASNISYYESTGGIPVLRKTPILKDLLRDIPIFPFKEGKREKGVFQSSVIILEPVVIPTIEDLVRFQGGDRESSDGVPAPDADGRTVINVPLVGQQAPPVAPIPAPAPAAAPLPAPAPVKK